MKRHPDDVKMEREVEAKRFGATALRRRRGLAKELARLVTTYGDGHAHDRLDRLREWFWAIELPKHVEIARKLKESTR